MGVGVLSGDVEQGSPAFWSWFAFIINDYFSYYLACQVLFFSERYSLRNSCAARDVLAAERTNSMTILLNRSSHLSMMSGMVGCTFSQQSWRKWQERLSLAATSHWGTDTRGWGVTGGGDASFSSYLVATGPHRGEIYIRHRKNKAMIIVTMYDTLSLSVILFDCFLWSFESRGVAKTSPLRACVDNGVFLLPFK